MVQANSPDDGEHGLQPKEKVESPVVYAPRTWPAVVTTVGLIAVAGGGVAALLHFSKAILDVAAAYNFIAQSGLSWLIFLAVVAQAIIYFSQRNLMARQWQAMLDALEQTRQQTQIARVSLSISSQAYVCVHSIKLDLDKERIFIEVENLGRVPAHSIEVGVWLRLEIPPKLKRKHAGFQNIYKWGRQTELFPGNLRIKVRIPLKLWLGGEDIALIKSGHGRLIAEGLITFYDGFLPREPKNTNFAYVYRLTEQEWFPQRILSPEELEEKKTKEKNTGQNPN
jgi:hypothetical protein